MRPQLRLALTALALAAASPARADGGTRCRVFLDGDYRFVDREASAGGCAAAARRAVGPLLCAAGQREFEFKFMFDGRIHHGIGRCAFARRQHP